MPNIKLLTMPDVLSRSEPRDELQESHRDLFVRSLA